jgi:hypothetical protein
MMQAPARGVALGAGVSSMAAVWLRTWASGKGDIMRISIAGRVAALATILAATLPWADECRASELAASANVECRDGAHVVTVAGSYYEPIVGEYDHLVLRRQAVGLCEPDVFLEDTPLPFEPVDEGGYSSFSATVTVVPPRDDVVYRYQAFAERPDGSRQYISSHCDADSRGYALTECGTAPFQRGRVEFDWDEWNSFTFRVVACEADCWTEPFYTMLSLADLTALAGEPAFDLVGQVVDVYGRRTYCGMPGDPSHTITRIERTVDGACGPVPVEAVGWGSVKALFR